MHLRFGLSVHVAPHARWHGRVLDATLVEVRGRLGDRDHPPPTAASAEQPTTDKAKHELRELREAAVLVAGGTPTTSRTVTCCWRPSTAEALGRRLAFGVRGDTTVGPAPST
ncbi:hypothetical protein [Demequina sp. SO4-18]|uniref:hypothetical protein n=1 Tax=Demequina sp. SO4-18 TaxID=3401026 RepID=UPI003B5C396C